MTSATEKLYGVDTWSDLDDIGAGYIERRLYRTREAAEKRADYINCGNEDDGYRNYARVVEFEVAATLGSERHAYEQRITGNGSDWGEIMCSAYDNLMANACESCTPEQMRQLTDYIRAELGSGTLTAEQVMAIAGKHQPDYCSDTHVCFDWQSIADELNAALRNNDCEFRPFKDEDWSEPNAVRGVCSECSALMYGKDNYCPNCGRKAVKR